MATLVQNTTHVTDAYALLPEQFKGNTIMRAMLKSWMSRIQAFENLCFNVLNQRYIAVAVGKQLDGLGALVGEPRNGHDDVSYRLHIRARIQLNKSSGTIPQILSLFKLLLDTTQVTELREIYPAEFVLYVTGTATASAALAAELGILLQKAKAGGVKATLVTSLDTTANTFRWNSGTALTLSAQGWGSDSDATVGGVWAGGY